MLDLGSMESASPRDTLEIDYRGSRYRFVLPEHPDHIVNTIASTRTFYEIEMLEDIRRRVGPGDLVLDIGAHVGNHTVYLAGVCGCEVLAFEPFQESFVILNANIALNGVGAHVKTLPIALGASVGRGIARLRDEQNRGSVVIDKASGAAGIPIKPLDEVELPRDPALLKIDVEGAEFEVLEGAQSLLRRCRPLLYLETIDEDAFETAARFLDGFGYQALACFNVTPTFLFAATDDPRIGVDERRLDRLFGRSCIRHRAHLHELRVKMRERQDVLGEMKRQLASFQTRLSQTAEKVRQTENTLRQTENTLRLTENTLRQTENTLRQTREALHRTRRWLENAKRVARRRKRSPVYRLRRALATTMLLPSPIRRFLARRLAPPRLRRTTRSRVRQPPDARSDPRRAPPGLVPASRRVAIAVTPSTARAPAQHDDSAAGPTFRDFFGLRLAFADRIIRKRDAFDGKPYLFIGNPRPLFDAPDPARCLLDHYGIECIADTVVGMTSANGGWYRAVARLKSLGASSFLIMLEPGRNERLVAKRVAIPINTIATIFIPNYKCGYASFRQFCFEHFDEFGRCDQNRSSSLNQLIDFSNHKQSDRYFIFSIIRNPISRFRSLYFDKFCRIQDRLSNESFQVPFRTILGIDQITPDDILDLISQIPDEFSDAHWKSQYFNTTHDGCMLVDRYVRMEHMEEDLDEISGRVGFRLALPKVLSTAEIARNHKHRSHFEREDIRQRLTGRYSDDFVKLGYL